MCYHMVTSGVAVATTRAWLGAIYAATAAALSTPRPARALNGSKITQVHKRPQAAPLLAWMRGEGRRKIMRSYAVLPTPRD